MIIDATNLLVGRLATVVAKKALLGGKIDIVNAEKAIISGPKRLVINKYKQKRDRVTVSHGPYIPRSPDRFLRRIIRGMLPYKQEKGDKAFKRIMCHIGIPKEFEGQDIETVDDANGIKRNITKSITIFELCKELGAKI